MAMTGLLASLKTMIGFYGNQLSYLVEGHITVVISVVAVLILTYVTLIPIILGVLGVLLFLLIVFVFATRARLKFALFGGHKEGPVKCENLQIKHDEPTTLSGKWACSSEQLPSQGQGLGTIHSLSNDFKVFEKEELVAATENFHHKNHLGKGAFGAVYKGTTSQGSEIAVKKLSLNSKQGKDEFVNEIRLVAKVRHRNLVKLLGCCAEGSERLIVYEYLPNNSLYTFLFDPNKRSHLDWEKRYSIILGVSRGLLYLHEDSPLRIVHRDIKAGNILLDTKFNPKIADFGIARLLEEDESHVRTRPAGTR